jgi:hypothetical protein
LNPAARSDFGHCDPIDSAFVKTFPGSIEDPAALALAMGVVFVCRLLRFLPRHAVAPQFGTKLLIRNSTSNLYIDPAAVVKAGKSGESPWKVGSLTNRWPAPIGAGFMNQKWTEAKVVLDLVEAHWGYRT